MANAVTLFRVLLALFSLLVVQISPIWNVIGILLIILSMVLDALDGIVARYFHTSSFSGSIFDILADRIIENVFFIFFAAMSLFNVWIAVVVLVRGLLIDAIRTIYALSGKTAFGQTTLHKTQWAKRLTCSKFSRGLYNSLKMLTFICYAALLMPGGVFFNFITVEMLTWFATSCLWATVIISLVRAVPVIIEGWTQSSLLASVNKN